MIEVEELAVRNFDHSLTDNIIVGAAREKKKVPMLATGLTRKQHSLVLKPRIKVGPHTERQISIL
jgi:hypothetical protein